MHSCHRDIELWVRSDIDRIQNLNAKSVHQIDIVYCTAGNVEEGLGEDEVEVRKIQLVDKLNREHVR